MKKWVVKNAIDENLNICDSKIISNLLYARGVKTKIDADEFLYPSVDKLYSPFGLKDMDKAVDAIDSAIKGQKKIIIYGDYDVDGITSTSILCRAFRRLGVEVGYYIPDRVNEGYGINCEALDYLKTIAADVIITVDCGVTSIKEVEYAKKLGMQIIITDHHECQDEIPDTIVVNPKRKDCTYPFKYLSGCGVAFKLVQALWFHYGLTGFDDYLDIAAIGTIADVVNLVGENRIIVKNGLSMLKTSDKCGIKAIKEVFALKDINSYSVAFQIAPRINAVGRLSNAKIAVELFTTNDYDKALQIAKFLDQENKNRQQIEEDILNDAIKQIENNNLYDDRVIVLSSDNWHIGVVGIAASKIVERYNRPVILICTEGEIGRGSGRSIEGFNLFEHLCKCSEYLIKFGGHEMAAGITIEKGNIDKFRKKINELAKLIISDVFQEKLYLDLNIDEKSVNMENGEMLQRLQPFGAGNPSPVFMIEGVHIKEKKIIGKNEKHIKMCLSKKDCVFNAIFFNGVNVVNDIGDEDIDIAFNMNINEWNNKKSIQLVIKDIRPCIKNIKDNMCHNYYKFIKNTICQSNSTFDFNKIKVVKKDMCFLKDFIYLRNGYILVNSYKSIDEIENLADMVSISFGVNKGKRSQIIICPKIQDIDFYDYDILIYDFLPFEYEYKFLSEKAEGNIYNFAYENIEAHINKYIDDVTMDEDKAKCFVDDLKCSDITGNIYDLADKYNMNAYQMYSFIMMMKNAGYAYIFVKDNILRIKMRNDNINKQKFIDNQNDFINKIKNFGKKLNYIIGEE